MLSSDAYRTIDANPCDHPNKLDWYALQVKVKLTKDVSRMLTYKGYEAYTPCYPTTRQWCDRTSQVEVPLLPGYVFVKVDPAQRMPVLTTPGVYGMVGIGKQPAPIQEADLESVRRIVRSGLTVEPWSFLRVGNRVRIEEGPLRGITGILIDVRKTSRVVVSVEAIERSVAVHVDRYS
jgi:transcription antitermination factor NusG